ncbi:MAG: TonB-dependent receptor plug domain-containing protein, partial [Muribaculaceae bacterium]|nr:TonB-dependent receptor plug domain-containing protein [Muribaculaceae bacterium]
MKLQVGEISKTPVLMGEEDVMKSFQMQPGVMQVAEGMAGISVHGGEPDQNMVMLDNMPLYSSDHCAGLFSAFNVDAVEHIDFYKSSVPAKYDGRLSSYLDVRTKNGSQERHNGSARLGLAAGAFSINGPIGQNTTYSVALRRSWTEALTLPILGLINLLSDEKYYVDFAFTDITGKITHSFRKGTAGFVKVYYGEDWYYGMSTSNPYWYLTSVTDRDDRGSLRWGSLLAHVGLTHEFSERMTAEFTGGYTRFFSTMRASERTESSYGDGESGESWLKYRISNNIGDFIVKGDFGWKPDENHNVSFGTGYTLHSFLPERNSRRYVKDSVLVTEMDSTYRYMANEVNAYIEDDWRINENIRINAGFNASLFCLDDKVHSGISPRISLSYNPSSCISLKAAYSRNTQYVFRLSQSYISLPTDQWIPIMEGFKPETSDKVAAGAYCLIGNGRFSVSIEGYFKRMNNLVDYRDEYYLKLPSDKWNSVLCSGKGSARGVDFNLEKKSGSVTGHVSYSLGWADRKFADKNGGKTFPARLDHRHTINVLVNWEVSPKVSLSAAWIGHSGSRFTLITQVWAGTEEID